MRRMDAGIRESPYSDDERKEVCTDQEGKERPRCIEGTGPTTDLDDDQDQGVPIVQLLTKGRLAGGKTQDDKEERAREARNGMG